MGGNGIYSRVILFAAVPVCVQPPLVFLRGYGKIMKVHIILMEEASFHDGKARPF